MNKTELEQIKQTYNAAGYFMLYVDEVGFESKLVKKLMDHDIYTINDFEEKFIKETYPETEEKTQETKEYLKAVIKDISNGILSAEDKNFDEILEAVGELLKTDKLAISKLQKQQFSKPELLKTIVSRYYEINDKNNKTEVAAFLKFIDEKHTEYKNSLDTK